MEQNLKQDLQESLWVVNEFINVRFSRLGDESHVALPKVIGTGPRGLEAFDKL